MTCPGCGAAMRAAIDSFQCDYCHTIFVPDKNDDGVRLLDAAPDFLCPICNTAMHNATLEHAPIVYCRSCCGMLIPMGSFETILTQLRGDLAGTILQAPTDAADRGRTLKCPHCARPMEAHFYCGPGHVVMDSCESCMLNWLDHGELKRIARAANNLNEPTFLDSAAGVTTY